MLQEVQELAEHMALAQPPLALLLGQEPVSADTDSTAFDASATLSSMSRRCRAAASPLVGANGSDDNADRASAQPLPRGNAGASPAANRRRTMRDVSFGSALLVPGLPKRGFSFKILSRCGISLCRRLNKAVRL